MHQCINVSRVRTTLAIDQDVYEAAKALADASGKNLGKVLSDLARKGLAAPSRYETKKKGALPVFRVSDNARIIAATRAAELMGEEGVD